MPQLSEATSGIVTPLSPPLQPLNHIPGNSPKRNIHPQQSPQVYSPPQIIDYRITTM